MDNNGRTPIPMYKGTLQPFQPRRKRPPVWSDHVLLGDSVGYTTLLRCYVNGVTLEYPEPSVHLSVNNSKGSVYATTNSDELRSFGNALLGWCNQIDEVIRGLEPAKQTATSHIDEFNKTIQTLKAAGLDVSSLLQSPPPEPVPSSYEDKVYDPDDYDD